VEARARMVEGSTLVVPASPLGPQTGTHFTMVDAKTGMGREI
jgi:S-ribosylhomocysteine lyase LuxS involved in autoinducer biosynthesis